MSGDGVTEFYAEDLAYIHHAGFGELVDEGGRELLRMLRERGVDGGRLVDLGCGSGTFARAAGEAGFDVFGVDVSPAMVALAREVAPNAEFRCASLFDVELPPCRAVTALGEGLNYCAAGDPDDARLDALFGRVAVALEPGGIFAFDVIVADDAEVLHGSFARVGDDWAVFAHLAEDRASRRLMRTITAFRAVDGAYRRRDVQHEVRVFETDALTALLEEHGFDVESAPSYGAAPLKTRRRAFLAQRPSD